MDGLLLTPRPGLRHAKALGRWRTHDIAYMYNMPVGRAGTVARAHPSPTLETGIIDSAAVPSQFGLAVILDPTSRQVRVPVTADAVTQVWGILFAPFPFQVDSAINYGAVGFGASPVPSSGACDVARAGYLLVPINGIPKKGDPLYVWVAATASPHIQGGFEAVSGGTSTIGPLGWASNTNWSFEGGVDSYGVGAVAFNV
jgi:hypothetical protein